MARKCTKIKHSNETDIRDFTTKASKSIQQAELTWNDNTVLHVKQSGRVAGFLYKQYEVQAVPFDIYVTSNVKDTNVTLMEEEQTVKEADKEEKIGRFYPGQWEGTASFETEYSDGEVSFQPDFSAARNNELYESVSFDANLLYVDEDQPDARVSVNGKDTGVTLANADTLGPMMKDGSVTVSAVYHSPDAGRLESNEVVLQNDDSIWLEFPEVEKKEEEPAYAEGSEPPTQEEAPAVEELPVEEAAVSFTESDVAQFTENYLHYSVEAMNVGSFDMVKHFHDPMGKTYKESSEYIDYIVEKGITEDLVYTTVHDVQNNGDSYHVVVEDAYNIFYNDGTATYKEFLSTFKVTEKNGELFIHELLELEELRSEDIH